MTDLVGPEYLGPTAAARYLRRSYTFVRTLVRSGLLPERREWTPEELRDAMAKRPPAKPRGKPRTPRAPKADAAGPLPGIDDLNLPTGGGASPPAGAGGGASPPAPTPHTSSPPSNPAPPPSGGGAGNAGDFFDW